MISMRRFRATFSRLCRPVNVACRPSVESLEDSIRGTWRLVGLRWRVNRKQKGRAAPLRAAGKPASYSPHLHFHLSTLAGLGQGERIVTKSFFRSTSRETRHTALSPQFYSLHEVVRLLHRTKMFTTQGGSETRAGEVMRGSLARHPGYATIPRFEWARIFVPRQSSAAEGVSSSSRRSEQPLIHPRQRSRTNIAREHEGRFIHFTARSVRGKIAHTTHATVHFARTQSVPELVWRKTHSPHAHRDAPETPVFPGDPAATFHPEGTPAEVVPGPVQIMESPVKKLDPGILDRLTDDVISRVERRIRIERERRGL